MIMAGGLRFVFVMLLVGRAWSTCYQGTTGTTGNCKPCPYGTTTAKDGINLPCDRCIDGFIGKAPSCTPCSADGPASTVNGKCACPQGFGGSFPNCTYCPAGLSTTKPGNGNKCVCVQQKTTYEGYYSAAVGCPKCDNSVGFYEPGTSFWSTSGLPAGKICIECNTAAMGTVKTVSGKKLCTCDTSKGLAYRYGPSGPARGTTEFCMKCNGKHQRIDSKGRCACQKGYGFSKSLWGGDDYCIPCGDGKTNVISGSGACVCKKGYAYDTNGVTCLPCTAAPYTVNSDGTCGCKPGYFGSMAYYNFPGSTPPKCDKCAEGMTSEVRGGNPMSVCICKDKAAGIIDSGKYEAGCKCRWGFSGTPSGTACQYNAYCKAGSYIVEFWSGGKLPSSWKGNSFPKEVLAKKPTATVTRKIPKGGVLKVLWSAVPAGVNKQRFVARVRRCACMTHATPSSQFTVNFDVAGNGGAVLTVDGGQIDRCKGDYHDQNVCLRARVDPVIPVRGSISTASPRKAKAVTFPIYIDQPGGWLSGMDYIPTMFNYKACHNITVEYWNNAKNGVMTLTLPKETVNY